MYKIDKNKKNVKLVNVGNIEGLKCNTKKGKATIVSSELKACYKKIYNFLISDDESSDGVKACLGEIEKLKSSIFNKYKEDLKIKDYQEFLAKIAITESEFKSKYHEREYLSNMINNFYKNNEEEMNIGRGR